MGPCWTVRTGWAFHGPLAFRLLGVTTLGHLVELELCCSRHQVGTEALKRGSTHPGPLEKEVDRSWAPAGGLLLPCAKHTGPFSRDCVGPYLDRCPNVSLLEASGKTLYQMMVKTLNRDKLCGRADNPWRQHFKLWDSAPAWRSLYKPPITTRHGDLQWRILHGAVAVNSFTSNIDKHVEDKSHFFTHRKNVFHCFSVRDSLDNLLF